jgi:uncharacterized protein
MKLFDQLYKKLTEELKYNLPNYLTYHDVNHTLYVLEKATMIAERENLSARDISLLKIAVLYHDTGYEYNYECHEDESCRIAKKELSELGLEDSDIVEICAMIQATKLPQNPKSLAEKIIADADLEYLGTNQYEAISQKLYNEIKHFKSGLTFKEWDNIQIKFLSEHRYHTNFCMVYREPKKLENLNRLKTKI